MNEQELRVIALQIAKEIHAQGAGNMGVGIKKIIEDAKLILEFLKEH